MEEEKKIGAPHYIGWSQCVGCKREKPDYYVTQNFYLSPYLSPFIREPGHVIGSDNLVGFWAARHHLAGSMTVVGDARAEGLRESDEQRKEGE